jgi:dihydroflavonol-4-reductase
MSDAPLVVAVTGGNGFLASHIVQQLLAAGHHVRATVRSVKDHSKVNHLQRMPGANERLRLFEADLLKPGSFDEAFRGAAVVIHSAMPVVMQAKDPQRAIVAPALSGIDNVVSAVEKNVATVTQVVFTSSTECVGTVGDARAHAVLTEDHYNDDVRLWML